MDCPTSLALRTMCKTCYSTNRKTTIITKTSFHKQEGERVQKPKLSDKMSSCQMKAFDDFILMVLFVLVLKRVQFLPIFCIIEDRVPCLTSSYLRFIRASLNLNSVGSIPSTRVLHSLSKQYTLLPCANVYNQQ